MLSRLLVAIFFSALVAPVIAGAQQTTRSHTRIVATLLMSERGFPAYKTLRRTGDDADTNRVLADMATNEKNDLRLRLHALRALEYYPTRRTEETLNTLIFARKQLTAVKRVAMRALARTFGVKVYYDLEPFLRHGDPRIRAAAAVALAEIDDGRVRNMLMNQLVNEPEFAVRLAIERGLEMIAERERKRVRDGETPALVRPTNL